MTAARPVPDPWTGSVTDRVVVGDRVLVDISFRAARARLRMLAGDGVLLGASEEAYGEGITGLVQVAGPAAGLTRLSGVGLDNLAVNMACLAGPRRQGRRLHGAVATFRSVEFRSVSQTS